MSSSGSRDFHRGILAANDKTATVDGERREAPAISNLVPGYDSSWRRGDLPSHPTGARVSIAAVILKLLQDQEEVACPFC